jgi:hypothetical protein
VEEFQQVRTFLCRTCKEIGPIKRVPKGVIKAPQAPRDTSLERLKQAKTMDEAF